MNSTSSSAGTQDHGVPYKVYRRRWYILGVFSFASFYVGFLWNMWGPIYHSMRYVYDWNQTQLALMPFYGVIVFIFTIPSVAIFEKLGLRKVMLLMCAVMLISTILRCFPWFGKIAYTVLVNVSAVINGSGGVPTLFVPPAISAHWFPLKERKFATALGTLSNLLGQAIAYLAGPLFVSAPSEGFPVERVQHQYFVYTWVQTGVALALFLTVLIYYPNEPPLPPSESAETERINYKEGCKSLLKSKKFWILSAPLTLLFGTFTGWSSILPLNLEPKGVDQAITDQIGFSTLLAGAIFGFMGGKLSDWFGNLKAIILACAFLSTIGAVWFVLVIENYITFTLIQAYFCSVLMGCASAAIIPVNLELASEVCYPIDEAVVCGLMSTACFVWSSLFLVIAFFPGIGPTWISWFYAVAAIICIPLVLLIKETYKRTAVDLGTTVDDEEPKATWPA